MKNKNCESCKWLVKKYGKLALKVCGVCGHYYQDDDAEPCYCNLEVEQTIKQFFGVNTNEK